jgi:hypothetical protein
MFFLSAAGICTSTRLPQYQFCFPETHINADISCYVHAVRDKYRGRFIMFSLITNIYNKKTKGPTLMELFTTTGKLKKFFLTTRDVRCVHHG